MQEKGKLTRMKQDFRDHHILCILRDAPPSMPLDLVLSRYFRAHKSLGANDRRVIGDTLFGMVRWKSLIDHLSPSPHPLSRLSCYKTMDLTALQKDPSIPEWARLGFNEFLYNRLGASLCEILNTPAPTTVRANLLKTSREALLELWAPLSPTPCPRAKMGIQFSKRQPLFSLPEFKEGLFEVQDEGSQLVASLVDAKPGDTILDYCSGSGGKTLAFAPNMRGKGQIFLHDVRETVLAEAKKRLRRAGIQNAQILPPGSKQLSLLKGKCDWVLIDVPCSGTGTLRRNPDQKWGIDEPSIQRLTALQREIIAAAAPFVKAGGRLVYATCSVLTEENRAQVDHILSTLPLQLEGEPLSLLPEVGGNDGFYAAVFRKKTLL
jgi:16S rRNA C967 or C1407 C5-methylase (RsmB/RsmF family)